MPLSGCCCCCASTWLPYATITLDTWNRGKKGGNEGGKREEKKDRGAAGRVGAGDGGG